MKIGLFIRDKFNLHYISFQNFYFQISQLNEDLKIREERWNAAANRFRGKISQLEEENSSLRKQVTMLEQERLQRSKVCVNLEIL